MRKIKHYKVNKDNSLMLAVSFVKNPAIESKFLALEKEDEKQKYVTLKDDYRHIVYGAVLRPDIPIYRRDGNEEYYLQFDKEAIEVLAEKFMTQGRTQKFTEAHKKEVDDVSVVEVWTKTDMIHDKSIALGLDPTLEVGTLFFGAKVYNDEIWQKVLDKTYEGFSVEAIVDVDELKFEEQTPAPEVEAPQEPTPEPTVEVKESILDKILNILGGKPIEEVAKPTAKEAEKPQEVAPEPSKAEEPTVVPQEEKEPVTEEKKEPQPNPLEEVVKNLKTEIDALKKENGKLQEQIGKIGKQPSAKPTNTNVGNNGKGDTYQNWRNQMAKMIG